MRHSKIELTMNVYTDPKLLDVRGALDALPELPLDGEGERVAATGTDGPQRSGCKRLVPTLAPTLDSSVQAESIAVSNGGNGGDGTARGALAASALGLTLSSRYRGGTRMGERLPIQKVKTLMGHSTIKLTADLYGELGMEDLAEDVWALPPLAMKSDPPAGPPAVRVSPTGGVADSAEVVASGEDGKRTLSCRKCFIINSFGCNSSGAFCLRFHPRSLKKTLVRPC
jgi:hypothetical protein